MKTTRLFLVLAATVILIGCSYKGPKTDAGNTTTLIDTYWKLVLANDLEVTTPADAREAHLILRPDYRITGFGSCNAFNGSWAMEEDMLVIGPLAATKMSCSRMDIEYLMTMALSGTVVTDIEGDKLTLYGNDGIELQFKAMYYEQ